MPRPRLRALTLWTGTLLCVLIAGAFVVSAWWSLMAQLGRVVVQVAAGSVTVFFADRLNFTFDVEQHPLGLSRWATFARRSIWITLVEFSLWLPFLVVAIPTLLVWRFWPKPVKPGHCRCGYNLTGLSEARCPECGTGFVSDLGA